MKQIFSTHQTFFFELGGHIPSLDIAYYTYGKRKEDDSNIVWVCHALTASGDAADWWNGLIGPGKILDTNNYYIICANILGSCYGTTGPTSINPETNNIYGIDFPLFTIRDMVKAHQLLKEYLNINHIHLLAGGSMGGYQALEWAIMEPECMQHLFLIATSSEESAWGKAIHTTQRLAIKADANWALGQQGKGDQGLKAARGIGMLTYRNYALFKAQQSDTDANTTHEHRANSYIQYQAEKLAARFDALSYYKLCEAMDTHNIARGRAKTTAEVLATIQAPTLVMGISSDILCPPEEQEYVAQHLPNAAYHQIDSRFGHDGFLVEADKIGIKLKEWLTELKSYLSN